MRAIYYMLPSRGYHVIQNILRCYCKTDQVLSCTFLIMLSKASYIRQIFTVLAVASRILQPTTTILLSSGADGAILLR